MTIPEATQNCANVCTNVRICWFSEKLMKFLKWLFLKSNRNLSWGALDELCGGRVFYSARPAAWILTLTPCLPLRGPAQRFSSVCSTRRASDAIRRDNRGQSVPRFQDHRVWFRQPQTPCATTAATLMQPSTEPSARFPHSWIQDTPRFLPSEVGQRGPPTPRRVPRFRKTRRLGLLMITECGSCRL